MRTGWSVGIVWIIAGIVVLAWPDAIRWAVGITLIVVGVLSMMSSENR